MPNIIDKLLAKFNERLPIVKKKRKCKRRDCPTILSRYDYHTYCFFHYDLLSDNQKHPKRRYAEGKVLKKQHKHNIRKSMKLWWKERKNEKMQ